MGKFLKAMGLETLSETPLGSYSADVRPPSRQSGTTVTVESALGLPAVFRSIQITAGMAAQLTISSWRADSLVDPAPPLVTRPDAWRPLSSWLERVVVCLATDGNAFLRKHRHPDGTVASLEVMNPRLVTVTWSKGIKSYRYTTDAGRQITLTADDVEHIWFLEIPGHTRGLGPIGACRAAMAGILDVRAYADGWFGVSDVPSGVLTTDQRLDGSAAKEYKRRWLNPDDDTPAGPTVRVLGQGLTYQPVSLNPEDAQWIESQKFGVLDIARIFGLPADYLHASVDGSSLTYANLSQLHSQFLLTTLFPLYLRKIEAALTNVLPRGQAARFDTTALLRPDAKTRAEIDAIYLKAGVVAAEEVRLREGWTGPAPTRPAVIDQEKSPA